MNNSAEKKPYLRSAENTVSLYEAAEIVFDQLKNNPERWNAIEQLCQNYAGLWTFDIQAHRQAYFANWILEKALGIFPYTTAKPDFREKFYSEFFQAFNIQLEGNVDPFLTRLGMLIRKDAIIHKLTELNDELNLMLDKYYKNPARSREELRTMIREMSPLSSEVKELDTILKAIDTKMAPPKSQS